MKFKESSLLKKHKQLLGNKRDKRKKVVKSTSPTPDLKKAVIKKQEGGTLFSIYNSIDPYIPPTIDFNAPELETEIVTNPIKKRQAKVIEEAKKSTANSEVQELKEINSEVPSKKIPKSSETWKSPYSNKNEWVSDLTNAYKKAGITNDNAIRMLISQDALESGWGRSAQGKFNFGNLTTGSSWKGAYVEGKDHDAKGNPIKQRFRAYDSMDEYAADKIQFLKRLYDFDENDDIDKFISKLSGANKGKRRYAEATNYATSLANVYNKFAEGGIIKAQNGSKSEELLVKKALEFGQKTSEKMSPYDVRLIDFIKSKEGFRPKPEKDKTDGKWTVGYGLTDPKLIRKYRNGITEEEASKHLIQHLQMGADSLATMPYYDNLNLGEKTALNDLIYNVGWNKFKNSKRLQSHLRTGNDAGAKKEMNHGEHQARGLKIRRNQNRQMYDSTFSWKYKKGGVAKYQPGGKTYTGSTSTNYYGDVVHHLPVWNKDGETNVGLPEVVVTPRNNLNLGETVNRGRNAAGNVGKEILSAVTPLGDIESAKGIYNDATSGNYGSAALGLGLLALPNFIEKPLKAFKRVGSKVIRDFTSSRRTPKTLELTNAERMGVPKGERNSPSPYNKIGVVNEVSEKSMDVAGDIFGSPITKKSEQAVFNHATDPSKVVKVYAVNNEGFPNIEAIKKFQSSFMKRNQIPFTVKNRFVGYVRGDKGIFPVYVQNKVTPMRDMSNELYEQKVLPKLIEQLKAKGYTQTSPDVFSNGKFKVTDLLPENMGYDSEGNLIFFDPKVYRLGGLLGRRHRYHA